jgi:hypothetical protein
MLSNKHGNCRQQHPLLKQHVYEHPHSATMSAMYLWFALFCRSLLDDRQQSIFQPIPTSDTILPTHRSPNLNEIAAGLNFKLN